MKRTTLLAAFFATTYFSFSQTAQQKADNDLRVAQEQLEKLQASIDSQEAVLIREVEVLDDQVLDLQKALRKLLNEEAGLAGSQRQLDLELQARRGEADFTRSTLRNYTNALENRIHGSEKQGFGVALKEANTAADDAGNDLALEIEGRFKVLALAADRLVALSGGTRFEGKAVGAGGEISEGTYALAGPLGYFSARDESVAGFTANTGKQALYPPINPVDDGADTIRSLVTTGKAEVPVDGSMGKALEIARSKKSIGEYIDGGGIVGYGILSLGLLALLIAIFKFFEIQRFPIPNRKQINLILDDLLDDRQPAAQEKTQEISGLGGQLAEAGVKHFFDKRRILEDALMEKLGLIQPRLERFLPFLALVAAAAPMMGLLGTVLGIMQTFAIMSAVSSADSSAFAGGISVALITTAMGLIVAIPVIIIHGMLKSVAKAKFGQVEGVALALLNGTSEIASTKPVDDDSGDEPEDVNEAELVTP
ncbi:MAG: MotA/TolQ/ExbB proton channel family protein [Akkermansiaceae bacterium]